MAKRRTWAFLLAAGGLGAAAYGQLPYTLAYSTYLGGSNWEHARDIYTDAAGFTYVVGGTGSGNFAGASSFPPPNTYNAGQPNSAADGAFGGCDVFITKMSPTGQVLWTKYMGGPNYDRAYALEVDNSGNIYIAGRAGVGFPTTNGFQTTFSGNNNPSNYGKQNGFVAKLDSAGTILWSTYVGTGELVRDIAIDAAGDVYIPLVLNTASSRTAFSTPALSAFSGKFTGTYKPTPPTTNTNDVGVAKLKGDGSGVVWATWLGGSGSETTNPSIRVDAQGQPHLLFDTTSNNTSLPTAGVGVQTNNGGGTDAYVAKLSADGSTLLYGTYIGGSGSEAHETHSLALDANGNAVVAVHTSSSNFLVTPGTINSPASGVSDIAVRILNPNGGTIASTRIGGNGGEGPDGIYVDSLGRIYLAAETPSTDFPVTSNAFQSTNGGGQDGVVMVLSADLSQILYATYIGGSLYDNARTLYLGPGNSIYVTGGTLSTNLPTLNAYDTTFNGGSHNFAPGSGDAWVAKFVVPEPSSALLLGAAAAMVLRRGRAKQP